MIVLDARVILQEKKFWAVQFTNCTALSDATLCQSHFERKKNLGGAICKLHYLMPVFGKVICKKKNLGGAIYKLHHPI